MKIGTCSIYPSPPLLYQEACNVLTQIQGKATNIGKKRVGYSSKVSERTIGVKVMWIVQQPKKLATSTHRECI